MSSSKGNSSAMSSKAAAGSSKAGGSSTKAALSAAASSSSGSAAQTWDDPWKKRTPSPPAPPEPEYDFWCMWCGEVHWTDEADARLYFESNHKAIEFKDVQNPAVCKSCYNRFKDRDDLINHVALGCPSMFSKE